MEYEISNTSDLVAEAMSRIIDKFRHSEFVKNGERYLPVGDTLTQAVAKELNGYDDEPGRSLGVASIALNVLLRRGIVKHRTGFYWFNEATRVTFVLEAHQLASH